MPLWAVGLMCSVFMLLLATVIGVWVKTIQDGIATRKALDKKISDQLEKVEMRLSELDLKVKPFWAAAEQKLIDHLTHPHPEFKAVDDLLEKLSDGVITDAQRQELEEALRERMTSENSRVDANEKKAAESLLLIMPLVIEEARSQAQRATGVTKARGRKPDLSVIGGAGSGVETGRDVIIVGKMKVGEGDEK
jgi:hypothetical protein